MKRNLKFSDLATGDQFLFRNESTRFNQQYGPFVKKQARKYMGTDRLTIPVDSVGCQVIQVNQDGSRTYEIEIPDRDG